MVFVKVICSHSDSLLSCFHPCFLLFLLLICPGFMSSGSPTAYLLWAVLACLFFGFLIFHLWSYDRFRCLRWNAGRQPGAFKRVMTYTYVTTMPLLVVFSVAMTVLKYKEGFFPVPGGYIMPKPASFWKDTHRHWLLPLYFIFSSAWALEIITHLEELTFWLFMLNQGPSKRDWFKSWEVRVWYIGSIISILGMPLTTLITRDEIEQCQAWVFLVGSSASTATTLCFLYVLASFPIFIRHVKEEGADPDVVVRLTTFYNLNVVRVMFRFLFTIPLLVLAIDGIQGQHRINADPFWSDFLLILGGIGCFISSTITLLIFFPRSITQEAGYRAKVPDMSVKSPVVVSNMSSPISSRSSFRRHGHHRQPSSAISTSRSPPEDALEVIPQYEVENIPIKAWRYADQANDMVQDIPYSESSNISHQHSNIVTLTPNRPPPLPLNNHSQPDLHPYVMTFTSPIDLLDAPEDSHCRGF